MTDFKKINIGGRTYMVYHLVILKITFSTYKSFVTHLGTSTSYYTAQSIKSNESSIILVILTNVLKQVILHLKSNKTLSVLPFHSSRLFHKIIAHKSQVNCQQ